MKPRAVLTALAKCSQIKDLTQACTVTVHFHTVPLSSPSCPRKKNVSQPRPDHDRSPATFPRCPVAADGPKLFSSSRPLSPSHTLSLTHCPSHTYTHGRPSLCPGSGVVNRPLSKFLLSSCHRYFSLRRARCLRPLSSLSYICTSEQLAKLSDVSYFSLPRHQHVRHHDVNNSSACQKIIYNPAVWEENVPKSAKFGSRRGDSSLLAAATSN